MFVIMSMMGFGICVVWTSKRAVIRYHSDGQIQIHAHIFCSHSALLNQKDHESLLFQGTNLANDQRKGDIRELFSQAQRSNYCPFPLFKCSFMSWSTPLRLMCFSLFQRLTQLWIRFTSVCGFLINWSNNLCVTDILYLNKQRLLAMEELKKLQDENELLLQEIEVLEKEVQGVFPLFRLKLFGSESRLWNCTTFSNTMLGIDLIFTFHFPFLTVEQNVRRRGFPTVFTKKKLYSKIHISSFMSFT